MIVNNSEKTKMMLALGQRAAVEKHTATAGGRHQGAGTDPSLRFGPGGSPVQEPPNEPKRPPVEEPGLPPDKPPDPGTPPVEEPWQIPPRPPVKAPPPKDPDRRKAYGDAALRGDMRNIRA